MQLALSRVVADTITHFATPSAPNLVSLFWIARDPSYLARD